MTRQRSLCVIVSILMLFLIALSSWFITMQGKNRLLILDRENAHIAKDALMEANVTIRMAIMSPTMAEQKLELEKILLTRSAADKAYKELNSRYSKNSAFIDLYTHRNGNYRTSQTNLLKQINVDRKNYWPQLQEYSTNYILYKIKIDHLIKLMSCEITDSYYSLKIALFCSFCMSVIILIAIIIKASIQNSSMEDI